MAGMDRINIEILADGTIKSTTDPVSGANHSNAEAFLKYIAQLAGGETTITARTDKAAVHAHVHQHETNES